MMKSIILGAAIVILSACASGKDHAPRYIYNEVLVVNNSQKPVRNLTIKVADTDRVYSCNNIEALGVCSNRSGRHGFKQVPFNVDWILGDSERQTNEVNIEVPAYSSPGIALRVVFEISAQGTITAYFEQMTPA